MLAARHIPAPQVIEGTGQQDIIFRIPEVPQMSQEWLCVLELLRHPAPTVQGVHGKRLSSRVLWWGLCLGPRHWGAGVTAQPHRPKRLIVTHADTHHYQGTASPGGHVRVQGHQDDRSRPAPGLGTGTFLLLSLETWSWDFPDLPNTVPTVPTETPNEWNDN